MAFTFNGIGTSYAGMRFLPDGSYITTKWFVFFYMPIVPLGSIRVVDAEEKVRTGFYDSVRMQAYKVPLDWRMVLSYYGWVLGVIAAIAVFVMLAQRFHWV